MDPSGRRLEWVSVRLLRFLKAGYPDRMPAAADTYDKYHHRLHAGCISGFCTPHVSLAQDGTNLSRRSVAGKHPLPDCGMSLPYAPADHIRELSAVSAGSFPVCQKGKVQMASSLSPDDLSLQFLLFHLCFRCGRMVLFPGRRQAVLDRCLCKTLYPVGSPRRGNGGGAPSSHRACASGARPEQYIHWTAESSGSVRTESGVQHYSV